MTEDPSLQHMCSPTQFQGHQLHYMTSRIHLPVNTKEGKYSRITSSKQLLSAHALVQNKQLWFCNNYSALEVGWLFYSGIITPFPKWNNSYRIKSFLFWNIWSTCGSYSRTAKLYPHSYKGTVLPINFPHTGESLNHRAFERNSAEVVIAQLETPTV